MIWVDWAQRETATDREARANEEAREAERAAARQYLADTDWMVTRAMETGRPMPEDIRIAREAARRTASKES